MTVLAVFLAGGVKIISSLGANTKDGSVGGFITVN